MTLDSYMFWLPRHCTECKEPIHRRMEIGGICFCCLRPEEVEHERVIRTSTEVYLNIPRGKQMRRAVYNEDEELHCPDCMTSEYFWMAPSHDQTEEEHVYTCFVCQNLFLEPEDDDG